jgi:hypothetical protein
MRKYLLLTIFLALLCIGAGRMYDYGATDLYGEGNLKFVDQIESGAVSDYCSSCTPGDPTDVMCEDGDSTGNGPYDDWDNAVCVYESTTVNSNNYISEASHSGDINADQGCTQQGALAIEFYVEDDAGEDTWTYNTISETSIRIQAYFILISELWEATEIASLFFIYDTGAAKKLASAQLVGDGAGDVDLFLAYCDSDDTCDTYANMSSGKAVDITVGTWYRIGLLFDPNDATSGSTLTVDGVEQATSESIGNGTTVNAGPERLYLGAEGSLTTLEGAGADAIKWQLDIIGVDDDTMPGACS